MCGLELPKEPIEYLPKEPLSAIERVWKDVDLDYVLDDELSIWLYMAIASKTGNYGPYDDCDDRATMADFFYDFLLYVEALYFYNQEGDPSPKKRKKRSNALGPSWPECNQPRRLSQEQLKDTLGVVQDFFKKYPIGQARKEWSDFYEAVQLYEGRFKELVFKTNIFRMYTSLSCLLEAGYLLTH